MIDRLLESEIELLSDYDAHIHNCGDDNNFIIKLNIPKDMIPKNIRNYLTVDFIDIMIEFKNTYIVTRMHHSFYNPLVDIVTSNKIISNYIKEWIQLNWDKYQLDEYNIENHTMLLNFISMTGLNHASAKKILEKSKYDICKAYDIMESIYIDSDENVSFISSVIEKLIGFVQKLNYNCIICYDPHPISMIKPTICNNPLCLFKSQELGIGISLEDEIKRDKEVVDLLMSFTYIGSDGNHYTPDSKDIIKNEKTPKEIIDATNLDNITDLDINSRNLLKWIIATNRSYISRNKDIEKTYNCLYGYEIKCEPPEKELLFNELKDMYGSELYYHGSNMINWHSILRFGLKNYSNTKYQRNGSVYGPGIYISTTLQYAQGYSYRVGNWKNSIFGKNIRCVGVVEVIKKPDEDGEIHYPRCSHRKSSPHVIAENENLVRMRYLLIN